MTNKLLTTLVLLILLLVFIFACSLLPTPAPQSNLFPVSPRLLAI